MAKILELGGRNRKLAAILHADVAGFSRLMGLDEAGTHRVLGDLRRAVDPLIASHGGRVVGPAGGSLLAGFFRVGDALTCAVEIQLAARAFNDPIPPDRRLELRIGVNLGDVIVDGGDIFGDGVNIAARLQALARPGTVCISHTVYEQVRNKLDLDYHPLGSHRVKNIAEPVRAYAVGVSAAPGRAGKQRRLLAAAEEHAHSLRQALLHGPFTRVRAEARWGWPRPSRSKSLASPRRIVSPDVPLWRSYRSRTCRVTPA